MRRGARWDRPRVGRVGVLLGVLVGVFVGAVWSTLVLPSALAIPSAAPADVVTVHIGEHSLTPAVVTAESGGTIVWVNDATSPRTVLAADASFDSGPLARGERFQFAFTQARTVTYSIAEAPEVTGTITVSNAAVAPAPAAGPALTPVPVPTDPQPAGFAFTGSATAVNGLIGGLVVAVGAGLLMLAQRFGLTTALSGFPLGLTPDDLLPTRRHRRTRRTRRARSRRVLGRDRTGRA